MSQVRATSQSVSHMVDSLFHRRLSHVQVRATASPPHVRLMPWQCSCRETSYVDDFVVVVRVAVVAVVAAVVIWASPLLVHPPCGVACRLPCMRSVAWLPRSSFFVAIGRLKVGVLSGGLDPPFLAHPPSGLATTRQKGRCTSSSHVNGKRS